jgi:hypothetical protein
MNRILTRAGKREPHTIVPRVITIDTYGVRYDRDRIRIAAPVPDVEDVLTGQEAGEKATFNSASVSLPHFTAKVLDVVMPFHFCPAAPTA